MNAAESSSLSCSQSTSRAAGSTVAAGGTGVVVRVVADAGTLGAASCTAGASAATAAPATAASAAATVATSGAAAPVVVAAPAAAPAAALRTRMRRTPTAPAATAAPTRTTPPTTAAPARAEDLDSPEVLGDGEGDPADELDGATDELADELAEPLADALAEGLGADEPPSLAEPVGLADVEVPGTTPPEAPPEDEGQGLGLGEGLGLAVAYWAHSSSIVHSWAPEPPPACSDAIARAGNPRMPTETTAKAASAGRCCRLLARI